MSFRKSIATVSAVCAGAAALAAPAGAATKHHSTVWRGDVKTPSNLQAVAQCESGGDPAAIGGDGAFRGKYQFMQSTWDNVAPKGFAGVDPATAPEGIQDKAAANLLAQSGTSPWPVCGS